MDRKNSVKARSKGSKRCDARTAWPGCVGSKFPFAERCSFNCITMHEVEVAGRLYRIEGTTSSREERGRGLRTKKKRNCHGSLPARKRGLQMRRTSRSDEMKKAEELGGGVGEEEEEKENR